MTLLAIAAAASAGLVWRLSEISPLPAGPPRLGTGYYLDDAELVSTGEDGRVLFRVWSKRATQRLADGAVELDEVRIEYEPGAEVPWDLRATAGRMPPDGKMLQLLGEVVAIAGEAPPTTIRTDYLELDPDSFVAYTDREVTIEHSDSRVQATGMRVFLKEDRLQLLSKVNGTFIP